jgi:hypothetical protein
MHPWLNQFVEHEQLTIKQLVLLSLIHLVFIEEPSVQQPVRLAVAYGWC